MIRNARIIGIGHYVPDRVVTNHDLEQIMDTSDEWIRERTGIESRRYADRSKETTSIMGTKAAQAALHNANITADEVDFIVFATLSPDYYFPGSGVLTQRQLGIASNEVGAIDIRNQCSGFIYALSVADALIKCGRYMTILVIGAETHSMGMDFSTRGRDVSVIFGDGAGAVVLQATEERNSGILDVVLHADGREAEELSFISPGSHSGLHQPDFDYGLPEDSTKSVFVTDKMLRDDMLYPYMNGKHVFKFAVQKFPECINEVLQNQRLTASDLDLLIPHQANLRISQFVQRALGLSDNQVFNNIQRYGNTTAASIPIALSEAYQEKRIETGDLVCLAAFGSGFTWGAALIRW